MEDKLLGVKINYVTLDHAVGTVNRWLQKRGKNYVVTPNPEMLVDATRDSEFKSALNEASLAIPDSPRLGWGSFYTNSKSMYSKLMYLPFFLFPSLITPKKYPTSTGIDLMEALISLSQEKGYRTGYLGGSKRVADKLLECLRLKYPKLKIAFCSGNITVNNDGLSQFDAENNTTTRSKSIKLIPSSSPQLNAHTLSQKIDILFVAFGHIKQEKWMQRNLPKLNTRVMVGVGGAFDYLSGTVPRAPKLLRDLGFEWVFRLIIQPWRAKRFMKLFLFVYMVVVGKK